jgi:hypothetical protein
MFKKKSEIEVYVDRGINIYNKLFKIFNNKFNFQLIFIMFFVFFIAINSVVIVSAQCGGSPETIFYVTGKINNYSSLFYAKYQSGMADRYDCADMITTPCAGNCTILHSNVTNGTTSFNLSIDVSGNKTRNITSDFWIWQNQTGNITLTWSDITSGYYCYLDYYDNDPRFYTINTSLNMRSSNSFDTMVNNIGLVFIKFRISDVPVNSAPVVNGINQRIYVCEGKQLPNDGSPYTNFSVIDIDTLNDATVSLVSSTYSGFFQLSDPQPVNTTHYNYTLDSGLFDTKGVLGGVGNVGWNNITLNVSVDDGDADNKKYNFSLFDITVIEINHRPVINTIGSKTVQTKGDNSSFYYQMISTDDEEVDSTDGGMSFNISYSNHSAFNLFSINNYGVMNFTANYSLLGPNNASVVHNLTVCSIDNGLSNPHSMIQSYCGVSGGSNYSCENFSLTITEENRAPDITSYSPSSLSLTGNSSSSLRFNVTSYDADGTIPDVYWYMDNTFVEFDSGTSSESLNQDLTYTFSCGFSGTHVIKAVVTDGLLNDSVSWNVSVSYTACPAGTSGSTTGTTSSTSSTTSNCTPKWECEEYNDCKNLKEAELSGNNINGLIYDLRTRCKDFNWSDNVCGYQERGCSDSNSCNSDVLKPGLIRECYYTIDPSCHDGILNCHNGSCEFLVDCGGPCKACPTCSDKIKNQGETGVDCGGPCPECFNKENASSIISMSITAGIIVLFIGITVALIFLLRGFIKKRKMLQNLNKSGKK